MRAVSAKQINIQQVAIVASGTASDVMAVSPLGKATFMHVPGLVACKNSSCRSKK
ncbi:hypothetical protein GCM10011328_19500 [Hafnia psychrotolerans]|uniref:Uncharacterized protein n=1 Tax=Hafnia psychrotolerans TaxID=1477018 RepID=A0ABQ1GIL5_9GAMM|nr:hypothetical protein GCM10011328_19500 [Hafnia psychrotolerans]